MSELRDYLATRRTTAAAFLDGDGPNRETLTRMLTTASRVPDHGKLARWRFIVFAGEARAAAGEAIAKVAERGETPRDLEEERGSFTRAPLVVAVVSCAGPHPKIPEWEQVLSAGAVCLNLIHAAFAEGYAGQWLTEWIAYDAEACAALGLHADEKVAGFIHIGVPQFTPPDRDRPNLATLVTDFTATEPAA